MNEIGAFQGLELGADDGADGAKVGDIEGPKVG